MGLCFLVVFVMVPPKLSIVLDGLVPSIPDVDGAFLLVAAIAGTTCSAALFIMRSTVVAEKGWNISHLATEKRDALVSATMMLFLSGIIMAVAAGTLGTIFITQPGEETAKLETVQLIELFKPLGGDVAALVLILGITGAGLSTIFPIVLIAPWLICDYLGKPRDIRSPLFRILGLIGILFCFGTQLIDKTPTELTIFSQAFQACILPAVAIPILIMINRSDIMGEHRARWPLNLGLVGAAIFSLVTTYFAIVGTVPGIKDYFAGSG